MRSRGAIELSAWLDKTGTTLVDLAAKLHTTSATVCRWRGGQHVPDRRVSAALERLTGIEPGAWVEPADPPPGAAAPTSPDDIRRLLTGEIQSALTAVLSVRDQPGDVRLRYSERALKALQQLDAMSVDRELTEKRIIKSKPWQRLLERVGEVLAEHPDALSALATACEEWEAE